MQSFFDRTARLRDQCARYYEPGSGAAMSGAMYSSRREASAASAASSAPRRCCARCRAPMVLELQLMPKLLWEMHVDHMDPKDPGMDWSTIDVFTCEQACTANEFIDEIVHVQPPL